MHALVLLMLAAPPGPLPLKAMVLYENGVGYFERHGALGAGATAEIPLEPGQLDDALKSLVVVSDRGVASVEFAPPLSAEAARAMAGLPGREEQGSLPNLCRALTGVEVEVHRDEGPVVRGRVLQVADEPIDERDREGHPVSEPALLLFGEAGLARVPLEAVQSIRPLVGQVSLAWSRAVGATALQPERERLLVRGGAGGGAVAVGYTTEAPVWRTTYRLVLSPRSQRLQGFALVHNDSDEAWSGVKVTLASGRPTSFLFPLAGPRYGRRELLSPEDGLDTAPQLATREAREHLRGEGDWGGFGVRGTGAGGGGFGLGSVGTVGRGAGVSVTTGSRLSSVVLDDGPTPLEPAAVSEAGDLFLYSVKEPVVLGARKSALLPIVDGATKAERVTVIDAAGGASTGVRLENSTALTLEAGTISVFTDGAYAGETQLDRVKPGEVRVLRHGEDLDVEVARAQRREEGSPRRAHVTGPEGARVLELTRVDRLVHELTLTSRAAVARTVLVQLPEEKYRVVEGAEEDVRSPQQPRYGRLQLGAREEKTTQLVEEGAVVERLPAEQLQSSRLAQWLTLPMADEVRKTLLAVKAEVEAAERSQARVATLDARLLQLDVDLSRTRQNLEALGKVAAPEAVKKVSAQLLELEETLRALRREREDSREQAVRLRRSLLMGDAKELVRR